MPNVLSLVWPDNAESYLKRGNEYLYNRSNDCSRDNGNIDRAITDFSEAIRIDPNYAEAYCRRGFAYTLKGDYDFALAEFNAAIRINPNDARAYHIRGEMYMFIGGFDTAIISFTTGTGSSMSRCGAMCADKDDLLNQAIADFNEAIRSDPNYAYLYCSRGYAYTQKGDHDKAIDDCTRAVQIDPVCTYAYYIRGIVYVNKGDLDSAIEDFCKNNNIGVYSHRARAYYQMGDYKRAAADWEEVLRWKRDETEVAEAKAGLEKIRQADSGWREKCDEQILALKNSGSFKELIKILDENKGDITEICIDDSTFHVDVKGKRIFERNQSCNCGYSINNQRFLFETVKEYLDSSYNISTTLICSMETITEHGAFATITKKGAPPSGW